jgi:hypothetical protein
VIVQACALVREGLPQGSSKLIGADPRYEPRIDAKLL